MIALKNVLVATDFSEPSKVALTYGREFARHFDAALHVLHVAPSVNVSTVSAENYLAVAPELQQQIEENAKRQLDDWLADADNSGPALIPVVRASSSPAVSIVEYAKAFDIDVIILGTHGRGALAHLVMGSVAERVVRLAQCPVLTVRHPGQQFIGPQAPVSAAHAS